MECEFDTTSQHLATSVLLQSPPPLPRVHLMPSPNRLANETSLYLRQHANNPVDWYPWDRSAGPCEGTRPADLPLDRLLGVPLVPRHGARELRGRATAKVMNEHFVCIKVDREERPDLDTIYMNALQS